MAIGRPIELTPNIATKNISSIATADQTQFTVTGGYRINEIAVYRNGVRLADGRDFTASDGLTVNLVNGATVDDVIEFAVFDSFNIAGTIVSAASSQNLSGDFNVTGNLYAGDFLPEALTVGVATVSSALHVGSALTANAAGDVETIGIITAATFKGDGSGLTGIGETVNVRTNTITVSGVSTFTGAVNIDATTDSTSSSTGALIVDGGVGIAKNVYIGAGLSVAGTLTYEDVTNVDSVGLITAKSGVNITGGELTVGSGITMGIAGVATFSGTSDVHLLDNVKLLAGDGSDLSIWHNGTHSYIQESGSGALQLRGANLILDNADGSKRYIDCNDGSDVHIFYNNSKKWETTNDGTVTTGIATATVGIDAAISVWTLGADGSSHYTFTGPGNLSGTNDPTLNLKRGQKYTFKNRSGGHPFRIQSTPNGSAGTAYNTGVTNNDGGDGTNIIFDVPYNAPNVLYYQCTSHANMGGAMYIDGSAYEISVGSGVTIGSAGVTTFSGTSDVHLLDNVEFKAGDGSDLRVYHNGSHSYIDFYTGNLNIRDTNGSMATFNQDGAVSLYHDNNLKFATTNDGTVTTGIGTFSNRVCVESAGTFLKSNQLSFYPAGNAFIDHTIEGHNITLRVSSPGGSANDTNAVIVGATGITTFSATPHDDKGDLRQIVYQNKTSGYVLVAADAGKAIHISTGGVTINNSLFSAGDAVTIINNSGSNQTITQGSGVTLYDTGDDGSTGNKTLKGRGMATVWFSSASVGYISGNFD